MAADPRDILAEAYGPDSVSTADLPLPARDRWAGAFSSKPLPDPVEMLRDHYGGILPSNKQRYAEPHRDVLSGPSDVPISQAAPWHSAWFLDPALQKIAGAALGAMPEQASALAAFLGVGPKTPPRALKALEKAKEIAASDKGTPGQRTEKAWKAGGQFGGWDQLPTHAGETDWMRYVPTFAPGERAITAYDNRPSVYDNKGWFGRHKTDKQTGTVGELTNLNPALLNEFPDIADIPLTLKRGYDESTGGHFRPGGWLGKEKIGVSGYDDASMAESLAHELWHALARRQGWSPGSNPSAEKRPWIAMGNDMKHYGDTAFDRYQKVVGEQIGDLEAKMHVNEAYKKDYSAPRSFPSYESIPQDQQRGKKYMVERSIEGKRPRDLPPSWQFTTKPENMRDPTTPLQNVLWHWPADVAKSLGVGYGINSLGKLFAPGAPKRPAAGSVHDEQGFIDAYPPAPAGSRD